MEETYLLAMRCPVYRRRDSHPGFRTELENLVGNDKGEGPSGSPAKPTVPMCRNRGGLLREAGGAKAQPDSHRETNVTAPSRLYLVTIWLRVK
jgi:hypothetical protein